MKCFVLFTGIMFLCYLVGFIKRNNYDMSFMSRDFTIAIKGFSILTVVWAHSGAKLNIGGIQFVAGIGVALFLICSGYGLEMSYKKNGLKKFWNKRILGVCVPFWIVELIGLFIVNQFTLEKYIKDFLLISSATGYGWFIQYIMICYFLFFIIKKIGRITMRIQIVIMVFTFMVWFVIESIFFANSDMPFLRARQMLAFPCGIIIAEYNNVIWKRIKSKLTFLMCVCGGSYWSNIYEYNAT